MPIRRRLVLYAAAIATAGMTLFGALLAGLASGGVAQDQDRLLGGLAQNAAEAVARAVAERLTPGTPLVPLDLATSTDPYLLVLADDGTVLYTTGLLDGAVPRIPAAVTVEAIQLGVSAATIRPRGELEFRIQARRWQRDGASGVAVAGQSTAFTREQIAGLRFFLVLSGLVTIVVVVLVSRVVIGRALRPLKTLAATAQEIGRTGDLGRRLPQVRTNDEVGLLTDSFNGMLDQLGSAQARLAEALAAQRRFVADASHELRSPLTTIRNNAEFLREHPDADPADRAEAVSDIAAESERMSRLVDDLLLLARTDAGGIAERRPVDLGHLAAEVARKAARAGRPIRVTTDGPAIVTGEPDALTRLIWILVDNAQRHGAGDIELSIGTSPGTVGLAVLDEGPGIPAGSEERIFDRFYRADRARSGDGAGLGLAIARSIAEAHGGEVRAANRPEGGAVFRVELPLLAGS